MATRISGKCGDRTRARILATGLAIMRRNPAGLSARAIGREMGQSHQAILYHFSSAEALYDAVAAHAVAKGDTAAIVYLIATKHPAVANLPDADRSRYLAAA